MRYINDLISAVKARQDEIRYSLAEGNALNIESYHRMVGQYAGLQEALGILDNLMKEKNDE
jgi:hypothetical protein